MLFLKSDVCRPPQINCGYFVCLSVLDICWFENAYMHIINMMVVSFV